MFKNWYNGRAICHCHLYHAFELLFPFKSYYIYNMKPGYVYAIIFKLHIISKVQALANPDKDFDFFVSQDGSGDFTSIQEAIDAVPHLRKNRTTIFIRSGTYKEKLKRHHSMPSTDVMVREPIPHSGYHGHTNSQTRKLRDTL